MLILRKRGWRDGVVHQELASGRFTADKISKKTRL